MAEKQAVIGICFCGVQRFQRLGYDIPMDLYMKWLGMAAKIQQRNEVVNAQCVEVQQMIEKAGFRTYIMKGQGNSALYKASEGSKFQEVSGGKNKTLKTQTTFFEHAPVAILRITRISLVIAPVAPYLS